MKNINTLIKDIQEVIEGKGGWDAAVNDMFKENIGNTLFSRLNPEERDMTKGRLRMSSIGQPCARKFWYSTNMPAVHEGISPSLRFMFLYGDILEDVILALAVAAGHTVEGQQDELEILGIKGHRDAVIDGVTVDVKTASPSSYSKFVNHLDEKGDSFGYLTQLPSYVHAAKDDPLVIDKDGGAFLVVNKLNGDFCLDYHNFREDGTLDSMEKLYESRMATAVSPTPPNRGFDPQPEGKSGNMALPFNCSYCEFKSICHPGLRSFQYKKGNFSKTIYLTHVVREPKVKEIT